MDIIKEIDPIYIVIMIFLLCAIIFVIIARKSKTNEQAKFWMQKSWDASIWQHSDGYGILGDEIGKVDRTKDVGK